MGTFVPVMGTASRNDTDALAEALFGDARRAVLDTLFARADEPLYVREIIRRSGVGQGAVQRELAQLHAAGLLVREERGNQVYYRANESSPVYEELRSLVIKTSGVAGVVQDALEPLGESVSFAAVFGSMAGGDAVAGSDIDLLVVGAVDEIDLHRAMVGAEETLSRPVNYTVMSEEEFAERRREPGFVRRVLAGPLLPVIGDVADV